MGLENFTYNYHIVLLYIYIYTHICTHTAWTKNAACHLIKQRMLSPSAQQQLQPPKRCTWGDAGWRKAGSRPWELRCVSKERFQGAQTLASSHIWKRTKFTNFRCLVFFNCNLLMFWLLYLFIAKNCISWLLPYLLEQLPRAERLLLGLSPKSTK